MHQVLHEKYYDIEDIEYYLVQTRSQTKSSGIKLSEVHGMRKNLDPNILPEKQHAKGRAGLRRRRSAPINQNHYSSIRTVKENSW